MPRTMRVEYPGAIHHVMDRGDRREDIFVDDVDRQDFLTTLGEACQKTDWQVHAFCRMRNHVVHQVDCEVGANGHYKGRPVSAPSLAAGARQKRNRHKPCVQFRFQSTVTPFKYE
jgi:hypothetical protein